MLVKLYHFPKFRGENFKNVWNHHLMTSECCVFPSPCEHAFGAKARIRWAFHGAWCIHRHRAPETAPRNEPGNWDPKGLRNAEFWGHIFKGCQRLDFKRSSIPTDTAVDGWNPANQLRLVVYPIIYEVLAPSQVVGRISSINSSTLPETNSLHLKMDAWNTIVSFWDGLFSGASWC